MDLEYLLIPVMESSDSSMDEWHNGTLSEYEEYYGKAKKLDGDYYEINYNGHPLITMVDSKNNVIIAKAIYKKSLKTIDGFIVDSDYRNKGYAVKFINWCIKNLKINMIRVTDDNNAAINLYKKCGFKVTDTIKKKNYTILVMKL